MEHATEGAASMLLDNAPQRVHVLTFNAGGGELRTPGRLTGGPGSPIVENEVAILTARTAQAGSSITLSTYQSHISLGNRGGGG